MSIAALATALWPNLRKFMIRIGKWLFGVLTGEGARFLIRYMHQRVRVFKKRLERVKARRWSRKWRVRFLTGRIMRWTIAANWLEAKQADLKPKVVDAMAKKLDETIPEDSPWEDPKAWRRLPREVLDYS